MPHFDKRGREEWVCQLGAHVCTGAGTWITWIGNVCPACLPKLKFVVTWEWAMADKPDDWRSAHQYFRDRGVAEAACVALIHSDGKDPRYRGVSLAEVLSIHAEE